MLLRVHGVHVYQVFVVIKFFDLANCRNFNLRLVTKARACKSVGQEGGPRDTSYTPRGAGECEK
jgi:hypothetical protein